MGMLKAKLGVALGVGVVVGVLEGLGVGLGESGTTTPVEVSTVSTTAEGL